jgi:hypothetical protein
MWEKRIKKTIFTLAVNDWQPEICELTFPLLHRYAAKIGADFFVIKDRKFPEWPITYEKFQIYQLAQDMGNDWNIYIDADALIHPETPDFTLYLDKGEVAHYNGYDMAPLRWTYDRFFLRDGRDIGSCNWFTIASDWCIELWHPTDDLTPQETIDRCFPTVAEELSQVVTSDHLIDDFLTGRNIAKFGLKFRDIRKIIEDKYPGSWFAWHQYTLLPEQKVIEMKKVLQQWGLL